MITWVVEQEDVDKRYTLQALLEFSKKPDTKVLIKGFGVLQQGAVTYLVN